jgi:hypothetical protein
MLCSEFIAVYCESLTEQTHCVGEVQRVCNIKQVVHIVTT